MYEQLQAVHWGWGFNYGVACLRFYTNCVLCACYCVLIKVHMHTLAYVPIISSGMTTIRI